MVISSCQMIGYLAGIGTLVGTIVATSLPDWKRNSVGEDRPFGTVAALRGLWAKCYVRQSGAIECTPLMDPFFVLPQVTQGCRVLVLLSSILSFIGVATTPLGMQCTRLGGDSITKARLARFGAFLFGVSGILIGAAVSWFADDIAKGFGKDVFPAQLDTLREIKWVYGNALFVGWGTMAIGVISCVFLVIGSSEHKVGPRASTPALSSNSSRLLSTNMNGKERLKAVTPIQRLNKNKPNDYYATTVLNGGSSGGAPTTALGATYSGRSGLLRNASIASAPAKTTTDDGGPRSFKTYV